MTTESVAPEAVTAGTTDIPGTVGGCAKPSQTGRTRSIEWRKQQLQALEQMMVENEPADRRGAGAGPRPQAVRGVAGRHRQHRRRGQGRRQERPQVDAPQVPDAGDVAAARPRLGRVRAVRHRADHRRVELPVRVDARARRRRHRRGEHRRAQAVRGGAGVVGADGRAGAEVPGQRRDRGDRGRRRGQPGAHRAGLRPPAVHRRHRDRPQGLRGRRLAPDARHAGARRQEPGHRRGRRRHRRRGQADRLDQADQLRPDLHRAGLRAGRREDPRRTRRQDQGRGDDVRVRRPEREADRQPAPLRPADRLAGRDQGQRRDRRRFGRVASSASSRPSSSIPIPPSR